ncbi:hypothetical protein CC85DRAFT_289046 [Cutaneotrichosporon oleaginosum]|uniref:Uncharacterized protein n=1 Tax=Cutaneotrichosporon oleaginosum TaxID=879819 RepID=A0A0J1AUH2_9TREE|nr:uncharacterized protein CC85DRAFT_289046 [Cutaneotrichosporon oleaginosum]KLT38919.1 hypothetical protein CC85DRAFT_289046 [Cutaneotrichosporon oleaginosum]TXT14717.1 hypothetical protein COLE_00910 [Cutaneotrichosporon oleaginosum]
MMSWKTCQNGEARRARRPAPSGMAGVSQACSSNGRRAKHRTKSNGYDGKTDVLAHPPLHCLAQCHVLMIRWVEQAAAGAKELPAEVGRRYVLLERATENSLCSILEHCAAVECAVCAAADEEYEGDIGH